MNHSDILSLKHVILVSSTLVASPGAIGSAYREIEATVKSYCTLSW